MVGSGVAFHTSQERGATPRRKARPVVAEGSVWWRRSVGAVVVRLRVAVDGGLASSPTVAGLLLLRAGLGRSTGAPCPPHVPHLLQHGRLSQALKHCCSVRREGVWVPGDERATRLRSTSVADAIDAEALEGGGSARGSLPVGCPPPAEPQVAHVGARTSDPWRVTGVSSSPCSCRWPCWPQGHRRR